MILILTLNMKSEGNFSKMNTKREETALFEREESEALYKKA